jgi:hypothetical protein
MMTAKGSRGFEECGARSPVHVEREEYLSAESSLREGSWKLEGI